MSRAGNRPTLGFVCGYVGDLYAGRAWQGVAELAEERGADLLAVADDSLNAAVGRGEPFSACIDALEQAKPDGLIVLPQSFDRGNGKVTHKLLERFQGVPAVSLGPPVDGIPTIGPDVGEETRVLLNHLVEVDGCRTILFLTQSRLFGSWCDEQQRVYREVMEAHHLPRHDELFRNVDVGFARQLEHLFQEAGRESGSPIDAVITPLESDAHAAVRVFQYMDRLVPRDVKVATFGAFHSASVPRFITAIRHPMREHGRRAVESLLSHLADGTPLEPSLEPTPLLLGETCGCRSRRTVSPKAKPKKTVSRKKAADAIRARLSAPRLALEPLESEEHITALIDALDAEIQEGVNGRFCEVLQGLMLGGESDVLSMHMWRFLLLVLQEHVLQDITDKDTAAAVAEVLSDGWDLLNEISHRHETMVEYMGQARVREFFSAFRKMNHCWNLRALTTTAEDAARSLGIPQWAVFTANPPDRAPPSFALTCGAATLVRVPGRRALGAEAIRDWLWRSLDCARSSSSLLICPLSEHNRRGFMAFKRGPRDPFRYQMFREALAGGLGMVFLFQDLEEQRSLLHNLVNGLENIVYLKDRQGRFLVMNEEAVRMLGARSEKELLGKTDFDFMPADRAAFFRAQEQKIVETGVPVVGFEDGPFPPDKGMHAYLVNKTPLRDGSGRIIGIVGENIDITEMRGMQNQLREKDHQLWQSQKMEAIGQLAGGVAHDFNNLLTVILGYSEALSLDTSPESPVHDAAAAIRHAATRAAKLVRQLLDFSRRSEPDKIPVDLHSVLDDTLALARQTMAKHIEITETRAARNCTVLGDTTQLQQVLLNLLVNARDAMPAGGFLAVRTYNTVLQGPDYRRHPLAAPGPYVVLSVEDTGLGIAEDIQDKIFDPFFTTKKRGSGTGMGLATAYAIMQDHGGWIEVHSEVDKGSTFAIYLPLAPGEAVEEESTPAETVHNGEGHVLVVDDEEGVRNMLTRALERMGYSVTAVPDGEAAVAHVAEDVSDSDVVLLDLDMPRMTGRQCLKQLKALAPDLAVVIAAGYVREDDRDALLELGADGFLDKPFSREQIAAALKKVLPEQD